MRLSIPSSRSTRTVVTRTMPLANPNFWVETSEHLARLLLLRREQFMRDTIAKIIGPGCPKDSNDMMTVLWFRGMEAEMIDDRSADECRFVVRKGEQVIFDGPMPSMDFGKSERLSARDSVV